MSLARQSKRYQERRQGVALLNRVDGWSGIRNALRDAARERGDYSGYPLPIEGLPLVIEPTFKYKSLGDLNRERDEEENRKLKEEIGAFKVRNVFFSTVFKYRVAVVEEGDGKVRHYKLVGSMNSFRAQLNTMLASQAWGIEQEAKAVDLLATLVNHAQFKSYILTGSFTETSKVSGVKYVFRRLRPTVALTSRGRTVRHDQDGKLTILCTMCMHPIGYYEESWGGCMCPTDDVIAHLMMMRGDEKMFWRRCNQHPAIDPSGGI